MEKTLNLDDYCCNVLKCEYSIVWDCGEGICTSCKLVGQSYTISEMPENCEYKTEVEKEIKRQSL